MKQFVLISLVALMCFSCNGQNQIPTMECGDCEPNTEPEINYIMFEFTNVIGFYYEVETDTYTITYDDADAFDYDNLTYLSGEDEWYGDFVIAYMSKANFFELLEDINKSEEEKEDIVYDEKWQLKEVRTPVEGGLNYKYYLVKNSLYAE